MNNNFKLSSCLQTFETVGTDCNQPLIQSTFYHNDSQPMSTEQKAATAQAA